MDWKGVRLIVSRVWRYLWHDTSWHSLVVSTIVFFLFLRFVFYPFLAFLFGSPLPVVAVVSESMEHRATFHPARGWWICTADHLQPRMLSLEEYWSYCGAWYEEHNISLHDFATFPFPNGFNRGDVMIITRPRNIRVGDVIVYLTYNNVPVIHRVVEIRHTPEGRVFLVKGDHNPYPIQSLQPPFVTDETRIPENRVIGKAWVRIPYLGLPRLWLARLFNQVPT